MTTIAKRIPESRDTRGGSRRAIGIWLLVCAGLVYAMIVLGGMTRLTQSGLSMVDWDPVMGAVPPITDVQWEGAFATYQQFPEYQVVNAAMTLGEFKGIFYVEYAHRMLGRVIGLALILPLAYFLIRRRMDKLLTLKVFGLFCLVGLQGVLGWFMVQSGLVDKPQVSAYRLSAHLLLATIIFGAMLWVAFGLVFPRARPWVERARRVRAEGLGLMALVTVMIVSGGFVAGTKAGYVFNTFPLMNGRIVPGGMFDRSPLWSNFFENIVTVQFQHRMLAVALLVVVPIFCYRTLRRETSRRVRIGAYVLFAALAAQIALGLLTLLLVVPVPLASAHQAGALLVFGIATFITQQSAAMPVQAGKPQIDRGEIDIAEIDIRDAPDETAALESSCDARLGSRPAATYGASSTSP